MTETITPLKNEETVQKRAAKGGLVSGVSFALNMGLNLIQVPFLLRFWPQDIYGLWLSVGALATLLTSLDGGHQAYVGNLLGRYYVEDRAMFHRTVASAVRVAALTSTVQIILTLLLCASGLAPRWLGIASQHAVDFSLAVAVYTVGWISTGSMGAILVRLFPPTGFFVRSMWWGIAARLAQFLAVAAAAWFGWGLVGTSVLFASTVFVYNVLLFADIRRLFPEFFPWWRGGDFRHGLGNFARSNVLTGVSLLDLLSLQGVVLLVTGSLGAAVVPLFTTLRTLANTAMQGTGFLLNPIQPDLIRYHVQREGAKLSAVFGFFWLMTGAAINGGLLAGLFLIEPVYTFWTRGKLVFDRRLFGWLAAAVLVRTLAAPLQNYLTAINELKALSITAVIRATLTVGGVLALAPAWGLAGVGAALFVAELAGSLVLPWWFTIQAMARLDSRIDWVAPALALSSTVSACAVLAGFAFNAGFWPWLDGLALGVVLVVAIAQWRSLPPEVKHRVLSVVRPALIFWRSPVPVP